MKIKIGVMGSAEEAATPAIAETARALGQAIAARDGGAFHIGVSPGEDEREHVETFQMPTDACDAIVYTGFGLKGRNVILVRSCDVVVFISGSIGSLNEFTIAYDEDKIIGCLTGTSGVADEIESIVETFRKKTKARIVYDDDPARLVERCLAEVP